MAKLLMDFGKRQKQLNKIELLLTAALFTQRTPVEVLEDG